MADESPGTAPPAPDPQAILDRMTDAFFALDEDWRLTYVNEQARPILCAAMGRDRSQVAPGDLLGLHLWEEIPEAVDTPFYEHYTRAMDTGEAQTFEAYFAPIETWFEVRAYPSETGVSVYFKDVTDRRTTREELERQNEQLGEFASIVSHDLRNPLNVLASSLTLAAETGEDEHFRRCERAVDRIERLIDDLLELARAGEQLTETEPVPLGEVVETCWEPVATAEATLAVDTDRVLEADTDRLRQLLENLLRNAVEHGGDDVTITVGDRPGGFYVADDGPGIPEADREEVFEAGHSTADDGTGFGLHIVQRVVEAHGWDVSISESVDGGARFAVTGVETA
ncbi:sensor histidine kinase [Halobacteriales archaeon Cl-PHB]